MEFKVDIDLKDYSKDVLEAMRRQIAIAFKAIGSEAEGFAKEECPVDTGRLRNSITYATANYKGVEEYEDDKGNPYRKGGAQDTPEDFCVYVGTNVEYAIFVEYGDYQHKTGKAHFLRDSITNHAERYKAILEAALKAY